MKSKDPGFSFVISAIIANLSAKIALVFKNIVKIKLAAF
jgi:hypothetical protein